MQHHNYTYLCLCNYQCHHKARRYPRPIQFHHTHCTNQVERKRHSMDLHNCRPTGQRSCRCHHKNRRYPHPHPFHRKHCTNQVGHKLHYPGHHSCTQGCLYTNRCHHKHHLHPRQCHCHHKLHKHHHTYTSLSIARQKALPHIPNLHRTNKTP